MFSRFVRMLDIIERCISAPQVEGGAGLHLARIDGSHSDVERQQTIKSFNGDTGIAVCLVRCVSCVVRRRYSNYALQRKCFAFRKTAVASAWSLYS